MNELSVQLRFRVMDVLRLWASQETQIKYQESVPDVAVSEELFNQWDDAFHPSFVDFREAFSRAELDMLSEFDMAMRAASAALPTRLPPLQDFVKSVAWKRISAAAERALEAFRSTAPGA